MTALVSPDFLADYRALTDACGWSLLEDRTQVELLGDNRAAFLHNLSTNHIRNLSAGQGCEAFLLNAQGKLQFFAAVFAGEHSLVLETVPAQGERLAAHLDRYLIREKVEIYDRSSIWLELLIAGEQSSLVLLEWGAPALPSEVWGHVEWRTEQGEFSLRRVPFAGRQGCLLSGERAAMEAVAQRWKNDGLRECGAEAVEALRVEAGFPAWGRDLTDKNLPQEAVRDAQAIHFSKGCYLGQETVAHIDALGHVNRLLVGVRLASEQVPEPGTELFHEERPVGAITSAVWSPKLSAPLALAYVRRGLEAAGTRLASADGEGTVVHVPV